jgi:bisphosphoglycerate-dependent phosphoglycerate mutase
MAVLVLLRHGESAWNAADIFTGWLDVALNEHGEQQAQQAGALLAGAPDSARGYGPPDTLSVCTITAWMRP